jgi:predicted Zn-dependent protease
VLALTLFGVALTSAAPPSAQTTPALIGIMRRELDRNFDVLRRDDSPAYFIGYTVADERVTQISSSFGALDHSEDTRGRLATVEVRVGSYDLDNTRPLRGEAQVQNPRVGRWTLPLTDDPGPTAQTLWRATDTAYRNASAAITRVMSNIASKVQAGAPLSDFSREEPQTYFGQPAAHTVDIPAWEATLRRLSAPFREDPRIFQGSVSLIARSTNRYYVNSEGTSLLTPEIQFRLFITGLTKADDGMELPVYSSHFSRTLDGLPDEAALLAEVRRIVLLLRQLRTAPVVDPYSGPAILSGRAAGVFFHEIFGHRAEGHRQRDAGDGQTFASRVGQPVLPAFLSVDFDPTLEMRGDTELMGHYQFDDEGVRARRVAVVQEGILQTFLLSRAPLAAFPRSNGHGRAEPGYVPVSRQSNLVVSARQTVSSERLVQMLKDEARRQGKPFGLLFMDITGGFTTTGRSNPNAFNVMPNVVYRIYTDDRPMELVRGVDLIGTPLTAFNRVIAASTDIGVFNGVCGAESGNVPVSASSPELLLSEVEVQKKAVSQEGLPILPSPPIRSEER